MRSRYRILERDHDWDAERSLEVREAVQLREHGRVPKCNFGTRE